MKDVLTDLNAEGEVLPLSPPRDDWLGHKGMVQAAEYIRKKLLEEEIITRALAKVLFLVIACLNANTVFAFCVYQLVERTNYISLSCSVPISRHEQRQLTEITQ